MRSRTDVSHGNNVLREARKIISEIACQTGVAYLVFATPPLQRIARHTGSKKVLLQVLTVAKSDVEWAAHLGRNVSGSY
jgi:hypothetical protein